MFYRGKDFLPSAVSSAIEHRRRNRVHGNGQVANDSLTKSTENIKLDTEGHEAAPASDTSEDQKIRMASQERKKMSIQTTISRTSRKLSTVSV